MMGRIVRAGVWLGCWMLGWNGAGSAEAVRFASAGVPASAFMQRRAALQGGAAPGSAGDMIAGDLYRPVGPGPVPAVVLLHGCEGWPRSAEARARQAGRYVALGYAALLVDSFGPRGVEAACLPAPGRPAVDRLGDAYGALAWLGTLPFVDASKVAVIGASQGGSVVLDALSHVGLGQVGLGQVGLDQAGLDQTGSRAGPRFRGGVAFYPVCSPGAAVVGAPLLVLIGALDDWTPAADCAAMGALPHPGAAETVMVFPGAYHAFNGESVRAGPREVFGHRLVFDAGATEGANRAVAGFLAEVLGR